MNRLIRDIEERLFTARDTVCLERAALVTEAWRRFEEEKQAGAAAPQQRGAEANGRDERPVAIRRALAFRQVLENMSLDLLSNPVFAGNTSSAPRAWMLVPEFGIAVDPQIAYEHPELARHLDGKVPESIRSYWNDRQFGGQAGPGHMALDFGLVVNEGLEAVIHRLQVHREEGGAERRVYREAMGIACRAVIDWAHRYAAGAERAAETCEDADVARCLRRMASACRRVPAKPARDLFEGLQAIALVHTASVLEGQGLSMSIGLPDRVLARFNGEAARDPGQAVTLARAFLLKIASNSFQGRGSKTQAITVGGSDAHGRDRCNAVTRAFLEAFDQTPVSDPHVFVRWHAGLDEAVWSKTSDMLARGRSMPMLINDAEVVPGLLEAGVRAEDAWGYCVIGCNEVGIPGRCCQSALGVGLSFNDLAVLDGVMRDGAQAAATAEGLLGAYGERVKAFAREGVPARERFMERLSAERPFPFCSACCRGCAGSGRDLVTGMPYPDIYGVFIRGTANAVDALTAFHELVEQRGYALDELLAGVDSRDPAVLDAIARAPKWGRDDEDAGGWGVALNARRDASLREAAQEAGLPPFTVCHVVRSLHHLDGRRLGPTLDGRATGEPVGESVGPVLGAQTIPPTAMLNSVLQLDADRWFTGVYNLNLTLPAGPRADAGVVRALAGAFFERGGQELQVNVLDAAKLRRAQRDPGAFRDLVVRVAGLNARFVELSPSEQEELIQRAEASQAATAPSRAIERCSRRR